MKVKVLKDEHIFFEAEVSDQDLLNDGELYIGREEDCHIVLDSFLVSRHHATLRVDENQLKIRSISDKGNLKVNGTSCTETFLNEESKIEIGDYEIYITDLEFLNKLAEIDDMISEPVSEDSIVDTSGDIDDDETVIFEDNLSGDIPDDLDPVLDLEGDETLNLGDNVNALLQKDDEESLIEENPDDLDSKDDFGSDLDSDDNEFSDDNTSEDGDMFDDETSDEDVEQSIQQSEDNFGNDEFENDGFDSLDGEDQNFNDDFSSDGDGFDEPFADDDVSSTQVLQTFAKYSLRIFGEFAPFDSYAIKDNETLIGRDTEKCQIVLEDLEVSKVHAVIKKSLINLMIEDQESSNGIILNGERINKAELTHNDEFIIGETTFTVEIESDIIEAEKGRLMPVESNQEIEIVEEVEEEVDFDEFSGDGANTFEEPEEKSVIKKLLKNPKRLAIVVVILFVVLLLFTDEEKPKEVKKPKKKIQKENKNKVKYTEEQLNILEQDYALALSLYENGQYNEAMVSLDSVLKINPNYKKTQTLKKLIQEGLDEIARLKQEEQEQKEKKARQLKIANLLEKAKKAVEERNVKAANSYFGLIFELDPENPDVPPLKIEIEAYQAEVERKKQLKEIEKARRQDLVDRLKPGKTLYLKKEYYKAIDRLEKFINSKDVDEDLLKEATSMLSKSRSQLQSIVGPLTSKARSFKEGQDLKQAYETYGEILKINPSHEESLNERATIVDTLRTRSMKIYREALIAESLSLFNEAKEKFQEVQQVSPINSEYYLKATDKLKNYLE